MDQKEPFSLGKIKNILKQYRGVAFALGILAIILGIIAIIFPRISSIVCLFALIGGLILIGSFDLYAFFNGNKGGTKFPSLLIKGIINFVIAISVLIPLIIGISEHGFPEGAFESGRALFWIFLAVGIVLVITGLSKILRAKMMASLGGNAVTEIILGVVWLIIGIIILFFPRAHNRVIFIGYCIGAYLIVYGIVVIIGLFTNPIVKEHTVPFTPKKAKKNSKNETINPDISDIL